MRYPRNNCTGMRHFWWGGPPWGVPSGPAGPPAGLSLQSNLIKPYREGSDEGVGVPSGPGPGGPPHNRLKSFVRLFIGHYTS